MSMKYEAPEVQVIELEVQSPLMEASPGTDSNRSGYPSGGDWSTTDEG